MAASVNDSLDVLAGRCRRGETTAFTEVYRRLGRSLYGTARRMLRRPEEAEDAVQETFLSFYRNPPEVPEHTTASQHSARR